MIPYIAIFVSLLIVSLLDLDRRMIISRNVLFFVLITLTFLLGLRYGVGDDFFSYYRIFNEVGDWSKFNYLIYNLSESTPLESGFVFFIIIIKEFTESYSAFVFMLALTTILLKYEIFKKISPFIGISFLIYFSDEWFWKDLSGARIALASTFILFSAYYIYARNAFLFIIFQLMALSCHVSAVIALPFYFIRFFSAPVLMGFVLLGSVGLAISGGFGLFISELFLLNFEADDTYRLVKYKTTEYVQGIRIFGGTFILHIMLSSLMLLFYKQLVHKWAFNSILIPMYVYGTALMFVLIDYGIVSGRIRDLLCVPSSAIILPSFILLFRANQRFAPFFCIIIYCIIWFNMMIQDREPYQSIIYLS